MTEAEWLACTDPTLMLEFPRGKVSDRKLRLFAVACCRRGRSILQSRTTLAALDALEAYADDLITRKVMEERRTAWVSTLPLPVPYQRDVVFSTRTGNDNAHESLGW